MRERESGIEQSAQKVIAEATCLREDIKILESSAESCEDDEASKDNQISTLREAHQEELFSKLQREKKDVGGNRQGTTEVSMILTPLRRHCWWSSRICTDRSRKSVCAG